MPNKHAAVKDLRKNKKRAARNARLKTHARSLMNQMKALVKEGKKAEAIALLPKLQQTFDKAAKLHVFHANKSSNAVSSAHRAVAKQK